MQRARFQAVRDYATTRLKRDLPPGLFYHSLAHTMSDVLPAAEALAAAEGLGAQDLWLLRTAAVFHDLGFVTCRTGHETASCALAAEVLPGLGHSAAEVATVQGMILATALPQSPRTRAEEIMADADLDALGRADFFARQADLRRELAHFGESSTDRDWLARQIDFLSAHRYFTPAARARRDAGKAANIAALRAALAEA